MNKVTSSLKKKFQRIANMLPPVKTGEMEVRVFLGEQLIDAGVKKTQGGEEIVPRKNYRSEVPAYVNHYAKIKVAYEQHGPKGVKSYVDQYIINKAPSVQETSGA